MRSFYTSVNQLGALAGNNLGTYNGYREIGGDYYPNDHYVGMGCIVCCLLRHEWFHGVKQIIQPGFKPPITNAQECAAWTEERDCLQRVLNGQPC